MISLTTISLADLEKNDHPLCLFAYEDAGFLAAKFLPAAESKALRDLAKEESFKGSAGECFSVVFSGKTGKRRYLIVGLGPRKEAGPETLRRAAASLYRYAKSRFSCLVVASAPSQPAAEGLLLASYRFAEYKKQEDIKLEKAAFLLQSSSEAGSWKKILPQAELSCEAVAFTRDLVNRGPSDKTPRSLATLAESLKGGGVSLKVIDKKRAEELGMGSFLAVARGSSVEPLMLHLAYKPKGSAKKRIGFIGKGITFDSGGLSLKPPQSMETMKLDMAGAAAVLGIFKIISRLSPKAEVHGICPLTYNMPGPDAIKPGDVVTAMNKKTIEILNTDAEGRLVLADALVYGAGQGLEAMVDLATLTGAVVTALGSQVTGAMSNNKALIKAVSDAAGRADEPLCELPLVRDYKENIKSSIADLQNIGKARGEAGSIIGGLFLEEFVENKPWVHLDIAGTAWADHDKPYCPKGGTGAGVRTLIEYLRSL